MPERIASRELDAEIAEKVMGWKWARSPESTRIAILIPCEAKTAAWQKLTGAETRYTSFHNVPRYSTDIAAAWLVVEKLNGMGWLVTVKAMPEGVPFLLDEGKMMARTVVQLSWVGWMQKERQESDRAVLRHDRFATGELPPLAICLAALACVESEAADRAPEPSAGVE